MAQSNPAYVIGECIFFWLLYIYEICSSILLLDKAIFLCQFEIFISSDQIWILQKMLKSIYIFLIFFPLWRSFMCFIKLHSWENLLLQMKHLCGLWFSWTDSKWLLNLPLVEQLYSQSEHLCGFWFSCTNLKWFFKLHLCEQL